MTYVSRACDVGHSGPEAFQQQDLEAHPQVTTYKPVLLFWSQERIEPVHQQPLHNRLSCQINTIFLETLTNTLIGKISFSSFFSF